MASWVAIFTIEKFGRRSLMIFGAAGMSMSMMVLAGTTSRQSEQMGIAAVRFPSPKQSTHTDIIIQAVFLFVFNSFFAIGWLGMTHFPRLCRKHFH